VATAQPRPSSSLIGALTSSSPALDQQRATTAGIAFTIALGAFGWIVLLAFPALGILPHDAPSGVLSVTLFTIVILAARALAFQPVEGRVLSLDSAYYVAAALCAGTIEAGRLVAIALTIDALARLVIARRDGRRDAAGWPAELGYVLYFGGMSGGLLCACGLLFGADALVDTHPSPTDAALHVVAIAGVLLVAHYTLQGIRHVLLGRPLRQYIEELALPGVVAEASLMPIGVVLVLLYDPQQPLGFILLSLTYLLINYMFARLSRTGNLLAERVRDLEILNATARRFSSSLQVEELVEAVAREVCKAIPEADAVALVHRRAGRDSELIIDGYDRHAEKFFRSGMAEGEGAAGAVMATGVTKREDDLPTGEHGYRSWLGVPLFMYGACEGVIAVQSTRPAGFADEHQRLLEALALQIASALQNAHLYELAMVDGLTGLYVRRYFDARIEEEVERSKRYATVFSMIMMDVDDFKNLNDTYGHLVGDRVLRAIANVVKAQMRGVDTAARYGGEEIAVILPRTEMVGAYSLAERIRDGIAELRITTDEDPPRVLGVTASLGIAAYPESKAADGTDLVRRADRALYRAKRTGKNRVELYWSDDSGSMPAIERPPTGAS
jgi:diguanylate cyclase (GGDEF)-like protein